MKFKTWIACVVVTALALVAVTPLATTSTTAQPNWVADGGGPPTTTGG